MIKKSYSRLLFLILTISSVNALAQTEDDGVKAAVNKLFTGMRTGDTALIRSVFAPGAILQTVITPPTGATRVISEPLDSFLVAIGSPHKEVYDERIKFDQVKVDGSLAMVWAPYEFYVDDKFSHCGVDAFQMVKFGNEWKIQYLADTRRRTNCR